MDADTLTCRNLLVAHDYDRFVLSQAAPAPVRPALWALYAFNYEISKIREVSHDPNAALLRLAWWQDAVLKKSNETEILREIAKHSLNTDMLLALIEARRHDTTPADTDRMEAYAQTCNAPLVALACQLSDEGASTSDIDAVGCAYGLCGAIRAIPFMTLQKRCHLPASLLYDIGLMPEQIHLLGPSQKLNDAVAMIAARAWQHLENVTAHGPVLRRHKALISFYLKRTLRAGFNPFDHRVYAPVPFLGLRVLFYYDQ